MFGPMSKGEYSWVAREGQTLPTDTERPGGHARDQIAELVAEVRELRAALEGRLTAIERRLSESTPPPSFRTAVTRADAEQLGAHFWTFVHQQKGPKLIVPVVRVPGDKNENGDGNIAYRVSRTDEDITQGTPLFRTLDELFLTEEDATVPLRLRGKPSRTSVRKPR
jgi:hypothetical protein